MSDVHEFTKLTSSVTNLAEHVLWVHDSVRLASEFAAQMERIAQDITSSFDKIYLRSQFDTYLESVWDTFSQIEAGNKQWTDARMVVAAALPKRGWYLSGQEPCTLTVELAEYVRAGDLERVDAEVMRHLPTFNMHVLKEWLGQRGIPDFCIKRLELFVKRHQEGAYEEATYIGVPLLDELAQYLYSGKSFTTKRGNRKKGDQSKPELAFKTAGGPDLSSFCHRFVQAFGSLQEDPDPKALTDENYWNRHAIVHGLMQRTMGRKDSAKCLMAICFLIFAHEEEDA